MIKSPDEYVGLRPWLSANPEPCLCDSLGLSLVLLQGLLLELDLALLPILIQIH